MMVAMMIAMVIAMVAMVIAMMVAIRPRGSAGLNLIRARFRLNTKYRCSQFTRPMSYSDALNESTRRCDAKLWFQRDMALVLAPLLPASFAAHVGCWIGNNSPSKQCWYKQQLVGDGNENLVSEFGYIRAGACVLHHGYT
eukprot:scaffold255177_cov19-Prasinocladus_malaysianus.AAC.2